MEYLDNVKGRRRRVLDAIRWEEGESPANSVKNRTPHGKYPKGMVKSFCRNRGRSRFKTGRKST